MKMTYAERKVEISQKTKDYTEKKCSKLDRYFDRDTSAKVTFSEIKDRHIVEITVAHGGLIFRADAEEKDLFPAIDDAVENIERQILKNKTKLEKKLRKGAFEKATEREQLASLDVPEDIYNVIRTKEFEVKPMLVEEAILQMNMLNHQFFFFRNSEEDDRYSVVYQRKNGGYGLIISK